MEERTFLLYVRQFSIFSRDYVLRVLKVTTDNVYRIIGKIYCDALEHIRSINYTLWCQEKEDFWNERNQEIEIYREPELFYDKH